jgi:uncharacterized membrane protein YfcA
VTTGELIVVAVAVFAAITVYMVAGFGFALLAMPLMTFAVPVEEAVVVVVLLAVVSTGHQAITHRAHVRRPLATRLVLSSFAGMPVGLLVLNVVEDRTLKIALGVGVLVATVLLIRDLTLDHVGPRLDYAMGFVSGVANSSIGTNGPPLVFDLQSRRLAPNEFRGTIATVFVLGNLFTLTLFVADGKVDGDGLRAAAVAVPAWLAGALLGRALQPKVPEHLFRTLVLGLLLVTGVATIVTAI